jgi:DNA modification methylase
MSYDYKIITGNCLDKLKELEDNSIDAIVTDPPAGISFMGKEWDKDKGGRDEWIEWMSKVAKECLRVLKPGGHALVWALPRTSHWTAMGWENGGFEPRDKITHVFGSGFPKSLNLERQLKKEIEKQLKEQGVEEVKWK